MLGRLLDFILRNVDLLLNSDELFIADDGFKISKK